MWSRPENNKDNFNKLHICTFRFCSECYLQRDKREEKWHFLGSESENVNLHLGIHACKKTTIRPVKDAKQHSPPEICKIFSYCIKLPAAINLTETNNLKVCATNPHHFREILN